MFSIYENNKKISGACCSFVLCLDNVAISPFIYLKTLCACYFTAVQERYHEVQETMKLHIHEHGGPVTKIKLYTHLRKIHMNNF